MKRSTQVMLLLMGTAGVGGTAYSLMPSEDCRADRPAIAGTDGTQPRDCARGSGSSSSGGHSSGRWSFFGDSNSSSSSSHTTSNGSSASDGGGHVSRGGFG
ncbi:hypothetical protein ACGE32_30320, partial [Klebsiella pneumoniae]